MLNVLPPNLRGDDIGQDVGNDARDEILATVSGIEKPTKLRKIEAELRLARRARAVLEERFRDALNRNRTGGGSIAVRPNAEMREISAEAERHDQVVADLRARRDEARAAWEPQVHREVAAITGTARAQIRAALDDLAALIEPLCGLANDLAINAVTPPPVTLQARQLEKLIRQMRGCMND